jgi:hypothetical protein
MATPMHHAMSSAKKHGGTWDQYVHIHNWFDETKAWVPDVRHRAFRHHAEGIFECERFFGTAIKVTLESGIVKEVPVRVLGEQHITEDCGFIPNAKDYVHGMKLEPWQKKVGTKIDVNLDGKLVTIEQKSSSDIIP